VVRNGPHSTMTSILIYYKGYLCPNNCYHKGVLNKHTWHVFILSLLLPFHFDNKLAFYEFSQQSPNYFKS